MQESIDFQNGSFFKELTQCMADIRSIKTNVSDIAYYTSQEILNLSDCIKVHTNLNSTFEDNDTPAAVFVPLLSSNSIMLAHYDIISDISNIKLTEKDLIILSKKTGENQIKGSVNLAKSKVDGVFSLIENRFIFSRSILDKNSKYSNEELAATLLHEIGHVFTHLEYLTRTISNNQALATLIRALDLNCSIKTKEIIFDNVNFYSKDKEDVKKKYLSATNSDMVTVIVAGQAIEKTKNELGFNLYDSVNCEYLADQFATRNGAGKYLVTGLEKSGSDEKSTATTSLRVFLAGTLIAFLYGSTAVLTVGSFFTLSCVLVALSDSGIETYDNTKSRYIRIKLQNTERLKSRSISNEIKKYYLEQNEQIDLIIKTYNDNLGFLNTISYWLKPSYRKEKDFEALQKQLERLGSNSLFDKSAKLSTI